MKDFFICDCAQHENKVIISSFVVVSKQVKPKKTGEPYLALTLGDRSGHVEAKMWDNVEDAIDVFDQDDFIKIKGLLNKYKNRFQITIHKVRLLGDSEVDFADYLPKTTKDIGELWKTLTGFVATFQNQHLRALIELFMADPEIAEAYRNAPAARVCIMLTSADSSTTLSLSSAPVMSSAAIIPKSTATCCSPGPFCTILAKFTSLRITALFLTPRAASCSGT